MGNQIMGNFRKARYKGFTEDQINYLKDKFSLMVDATGHLDVRKLQNVYKCDIEQAKKVFDYLDLEGSGTVDFFKFTCGAAQLCQSPLSETATMLYDIFNFRKKDNIQVDELRLFVRTYMHYLAFLDDETIDDETIDLKAKALMKKWDLDKDGQLSIDEWETMLQRDPDFKQYMYRMGFMTRSEMGYDDDNYQDCDSDLESELDRKNMDRDERIEKIKNGIEHNEKPEGENEDQFGEEIKEKGDQFRANESWRICKNYPPNGFVAKKTDSDAPKIHLELEYVHGYRCHDARNNLKFGPNGTSIIYHTAAVGIKLDVKSNKQEFSFEHSDDITCLDISETGDRAVTGQVGAKPLLCVWSTKTMSTVVVFSGNLLKGIGSCCISADGKLVAATALDDFHTICVYDVDAAVEAKKDPKSKSTGLIATGRCTRAEILSLRFHPTERLIVAACMKEVQFVTFGANAIKCDKGVWAKQSPQAVMAVAFLNGNCVTAMFNGNLFSWTGSSVSNVIKAHTGPCTSLTERKKGKGVISGGKNGIYMIWNEALVLVTSVSILDCIPSLKQIKIISVCENSVGDLLFGMRGSEIVLLPKGDISKATVLNQGHYDLELWGLANHPNSKVYYTAGEDKLVCKFDVKSRKLVQVSRIEAQLLVNHLFALLQKTTLTYPSKVLAISPNGSMLAVGCKNGLVYIMDPETLSESKQIKEFINPDKDLVSFMKFSPNSALLLVAYAPPISSVLGFDVKAGFKKVFATKGSPSRITSIDFTLDGSAIQLNNTSYEILHYSMTNGAQETSGMTKYKDEKWASWNLTLGWPTQGIWPPCSSGDDINSVDRSPSGDIIATADDFSKIKLFKFPSHADKSSFVKFSGHSSHVTNVRFLSSETHLISTGGEEKSVFQWKYDRCDHEGGTHNGRGAQNEDDDTVSDEEDVNGYFSEEELDKGDQALAVKAFLGEVKASTPSWYAPNPKKYNVQPEGEITLEYVHGYKFQYIKDECRDMIRYSSDFKSIIFPAAAVVVKQEKKLGGKQDFFIKHVEDIVSFSLHPTRSFAATGQMAAKGKAKCIDLYVWDVETKEVMAHFNDFHRRAIVLTSFSPNGQLLLSIGQDDDNSLAIHEWSAKRLVATSPVDKAKITSIAWKSDTEFVTTGFKVVKFWTLNGRNVKGTNGSVGAAKFVSQFCSIFIAGTCFTGSGEGSLYSWSGSSGTVVKGAKHEKKVQSLMYVAATKILLSGGMDGKILKWSVSGSQLKPSGALFDLSTQPSVLQLMYPCGVVSLDVQPGTDNVLVGTVGGEAYEINAGKSKLLLQGHYDGELWGLATSPLGEHKFITTGGNEWLAIEQNKDCNNNLGVCVELGDKTIRLWDVTKRRMLASTQPMNNDVRAVHWGRCEEGDFVVVGDDLGFVYLLDSKTLQVKATHNSHFTKMKARQSTYWIEDVKISPDGKMIAFGAHGGASKLEIVNIVGGKRFGTSFEINCGLTSALLHVDWSVDSTVCVVNSQAYELKFVGIPGKKNIASSSAKDIEFASWTCKIGFPVQGVFQGVDYTDVNSVARSNSGGVLASGNDDSMIRLFKYPVVVEKQVHKSYLGHSSHITRVRFTSDDMYLISTGGNDKCAMVWRTTFGSLEHNLSNSSFGDLMAHNYDAGEDYIDEIDVPKQKIKLMGTMKHTQGEGLIKNDEDDYDDGDDAMFEHEELDKGDEFMAVKPWLGAIKEPSYKYFKDKQQSSAPPVRIAPEYVFGIRTKDQRGNLRFLKSGKVVYNAAALGIVLDLETNTQTFFNCHTDDIIALDLEPEGRLVATGEIGPKPYIYVWDAETMEIKHSWKGAIQKGVAALAFSPSGKKLVAAAIDDDHYIGVFDLVKDSYLTFKGGREIIVDIDWQTDSSFVTIGVKHFRVWSAAQPEYKSVKGEFGKGNNLLSGLGFTAQSTTLVGSASGDLQLWKGNSFTKNAVEKLHAGGIETVRVDEQYVFTGGKDRIVNVLDSTSFKVITSIDVGALFPSTLSGEVRSVCPSGDFKRVIVATLGCEILEFRTKQVPYTAATKFVLHKCHMQAHFSPNLKWTNEVWGLAVFPNDPDKICTCSDDGTIRVWSRSERRLLCVTTTLLDAKNNETPRDHVTGDFNDSVKGRAVAVSPDGDSIILGFKDGTLREFAVEDNKITQTKIVKHAARWISDIKFSPDGTTVAVGSHDCTIYVYSYPDWKPRCKPMKKHSSYITHIDFSRDGNYLHSTCGAYELLFWDANSGKQMTSGASALRDEIWHSWTVTLGWAVQGIWPECADGTDINAVDRSNMTIAKNNDTEKSYHLLATGDDFSQIRVLRFPSLKKSSKGAIGKGHSSHVTNVKWSADDEFIFSTGGEDQCVIIWKVDRI